MFSLFLRFYRFHSQSELGPAFSVPPFSTRAFLVMHFPVLHFPILHFSTPEIRPLIFQSCRSVFDLFVPSFSSPAFSYDPL